MIISKRLFRVCLFLTATLLFVGCDTDDTSSGKSTDQPKTVSNTSKTIHNKKKQSHRKVIAKMQTSMGDIVLELDKEKAPITVANFVKYAKDGFYDGTIFHRVIRGFMIQGGGFTKDMTKKKTRNPIVNESNNGLGNYRGTISMARTADPNSATSQFFINHRDNNMSLDRAEGNPGYAVFGKVIAGMDVVDKIASLKTANIKGMRNVPVEAVVIENVTIEE